MRLLRQLVSRLVSTRGACETKVILLREKHLCSRLRQENVQTDRVCDGVCDSVCVMVCV